MDSLYFPPGNEGSSTVTQVTGVLGHRCRIQPLEPDAVPAVRPDLPSQVQSSASSGSAAKQLKQLTRLTFKTAEAPLAAAALSASSHITATYDLLAIQPLSERVLAQAKPP